MEYVNKKYQTIWNFIERQYFFETASLSCWLITLKRIYSCEESIKYYLQKDMNLYLNTRETLS